MNRLSVIGFAFFLAVLRPSCGGDDDSGDLLDEVRQGEPEVWQELEARLYVEKIFARYGEQGALSFEGFEHLMEGLGLGNVVIGDHDIADHRITDRFQSIHDDHNHSVVTSTGQQRPGEVRDDDDVKDDLAPTDDDYHHHHHHWHDDIAKKRSPSADGATNDDGVVKRSLPEHHDHNHDHEHLDSKCLSPQEILQMYKIETNSTISVFSFLHLCPAILYQIEHDACHVIGHHIDGSRELIDDDDDLRLYHSKHGHRHDYDKEHEHGEEHDHGHGDEAEHDHANFHHYHHHHPHQHVHYEDIFLGNDTVAVFVARSFFDIPGKVWGYAILSVTAISLVGLVCVAVVPIMNRMMYDYLVQFLVALAVGTLTGDAILHLIPHSLITHSHEEGEDGHDEHTEAVYKGCVVLGGIYIFFIAERMMAIVTDLRKKKQSKQHGEKGSSVWTEMSVYEGVNSDIGEKLSRHNERINSCQNFTKEYPTLLNGATIAEENAEELKKLREYDDDHHDDVTIVISKHDDDGDGGHNKGQGHKGHGHSHEAPKSISSIAWMVIMGDGLHNFTDGLAIGAAFGASITVGLSTSIAVFCHELPHELGDFAVLLKAGMSVRLALFYNIVSSVLCFIGLVVGVAVGNISSAGSWIFALTAGIFLYISLVDMLPEISIAENMKSQRKCCHLLLQILGISTGVAIMLVIALFESDIKIG